MTFYSIGCKSYVTIERRLKFQIFERAIIDGFFETVVIKQFRKIQRN